ncbi:MAG: hypothetical protein AAF669_06570, partial [Pseudomonadota bacterium]
IPPVVDSGGSLDVVALFADAPPERVVGVGPGVAAWSVEPDKLIVAVPVVGTGLRVVAVGVFGFVVQAAFGVVFVAGITALVDASATLVVVVCCRWGLASVWVFVLAAADVLVAVVVVLAVVVLLVVDMVDVGDLVVRVVLVFGVAPVAVGLALQVACRVVVVVAVDVRGVAVLVRLWVRNAVADALFA